jgi:peptidoglycan hydrolase-like protein with peptidoglycan-binding domain
MTHPATAALLLALLAPALPCLADEAEVGKAVRPGIFPVLKEGARGEEVKLLQQALNRQVKPAPALPADGAFGPSTRDAVKAFQKANGLDPDGVVGARTWQKLYEVTVNANVHTSPVALAVLRGLLDEAGLETATLTSGYRSPHDQARIMYGNLKARGVATEKALYGPLGDQVIDVYAAHTDKPRAEVIARMEAKIRALGPGNVSRHLSTDEHVFDVAPSTVADRDRFEATLEAARKAGTIARWLGPPRDRSYHIEVPRKP